MARDPVAIVLAARRSIDPVAALGRAARDLGPHTALRILAGLQRGQFSTAQAKAIGLTPAAIRWLRTSGETRGLRKSVWQFISAGDTSDAGVTAWLRCWPHAVISYEDAAVFHGLEKGCRSEHHVTVAHGRSIAPAGVTVHVSRSLEACDRIWDGAIAYTTLARTVCDLADPTQPWETLTRVDNAVALYRAGQLPEPEWNVPVYDNQGLIAIADALWRPWQVISEKEGLRFHTAPAKRRQDAERFSRFLGQLRCPPFHVAGCRATPLYVVETLARPLAAAGAPVDLARIPRHIELPDQPFRA